MTQNYFVDENKIWFRPESGWPKEVPKNIDFPRIALGEILRKSAKKWPERRVMWCIDTWMNFSELDRNVDALATALHTKGIRKGDCVALLLPNSFQYVISYYALVRIGAIPSGINPTYKPAEVLHQLKETNAVGLITLDALYEPIVAPIIKKTNVKLVIATNIVDMAKISPLKKFLGKRLKDKKTGKPLIPSGPVPENALKFMELLKTPPAVPEVEIDVENDPATYIMTGGTTGVPKAAVLTHFNLVSNVIQCAAWLYKTGPGVAGIGVLPLFHSFGMTCVMNIAIYKGMWMLLFPRPPETEELCKRVSTLVDEKGAIYPGAEILFIRLADFKDVKKYNLSGKFLFCVSGAGPLHRPVQEKFERITGSKLVEGYGLTEASPVVSAGPFYGKRKIGTIGLPFPGTEWKIVDKDDPMKELGIGPDQVGELAVAGPQVMKCYLNRPEETAETIFEAGGKRWLLTGDIGYMDEDGQVVIMDRKKQLIKYKGYSVFPKEVEELIGKHEAVAEVAVAGLPDTEAGEIIKAWVVLKPNYKGKLTTEDLKTWCEQNMTHYKVPRYIEFRSELPKSLVGKVLRRELQEADPLFKKAKGCTEVEPQ